MASVVDMEECNDGSVASDREVHVDVDCNHSLVTVDTGAPADVDCNDNDNQLAAEHVKTSSALVVKHVDNDNSAPASGCVVTQPELEANKDMQGVTPQPGVQTAVTPQSTVETVVTPQSTVETAVKQQPGVNMSVTQQSAAKTSLASQPTVETVVTPLSTAETAVTPQSTAETAVTPQSTAETAVTPQSTAETAVTPQSTAQTTAIAQCTPETAVTPQSTPETVVTAQFTEETDDADDVLLDETVSLPEVCVNSNKQRTSPAAAVQAASHGRSHISGHPSDQSTAEGGFDNIDCGPSASSIAASSTQHPGVIKSAAYAPAVQSANVSHSNTAVRHKQQKQRIPDHKATDRKRTSNLKKLRQWVTCSRVPQEAEPEGEAPPKRVEPFKQHFDSPPPPPATDTIVVEHIEDAFGEYEVSGRALCVIFTLFTGELTGYLHDQRHAFTFFKETLKYETYCHDNNGHVFTNCNRAQLFSSINAVKKLIKVKSKAINKPAYDRIVVIILTHGLQDGLMTCRDGVGVLEEHTVELGSDGIYYPKPMLTKVDDIVKEFKHDTMPELKGVPRLFLIQACSGSKSVKAANSAAPSVRARPSYDLSQLHLRSEVPIDADILVYYATTPNHESYVSPTDGSWLIKNMLKVFKKHYRERHVEDMLTVVTLAVAEERGIAKADDGVSEYETAQIPVKHSTLRRRLFLTKQ